MCQVTDWEKAVEFHGHVCPGLALGYRVAEAALQELAAKRSVDEKLVVVVENDACGVDAIQVITGCTFGKGNLLFRDYGKHVYTFGQRGDKKALRIAVSRKYWSPDQDYQSLRQKVFSGQATEEEQSNFAEAQTKTVERVLEMPAKDLLELKYVDWEWPEKACIFPSVDCSLCHEPVMEPRARLQNGKPVCMPCSQGYDCFVIREKG